MSPTWHFARTQSGQDSKVEKALRNRRYFVYRPIVPAKVKYTHGHEGPGAKSMFAGYILVRDGLCQGWGWLENCPGMLGYRPLLVMHGRFATLDEDDPEFQRIRDAERAAWAPKEEKVVEFHVGDRHDVPVKANDGTFSWWPAQIEALDDDARVSLLLDILGRKVRMRTTRADLIRHMSERGACNVRDAV